MHSYQSIMANNYRSALISLIFIMIVFIAVMVRVVKKVLLKQAHECDSFKPHLIMAYQLADMLIAKPLIKWKNFQVK